MLRYPTTSNTLYIFERILGDARVVVAVNLGAKKEAVKFVGAAPEVAGLTNLFAPSVKAAIPSKMRPGEYVVFTTPLTKPGCCAAK